MDLFRVLLVVVLVTTFNRAVSAPKETPEFVDLADQLDYIAVENNIEIQGMELTQFLPPRTVKGPGKGSFLSLVRFPMGQR